jgi:PEP-CTERM motif
MVWRSKFGKSENMIRNVGLLLLVSAALTLGSALSLQSNGSGPTCSGSGMGPTLPNGDTFCTGATPMTGSLSGYTSGSGVNANLTPDPSGNLVADYAIPTANIPDTANGAGGWATPPGDGATWISTYDTSGDALDTGWGGSMTTWDAAITVPNADCAASATITKGGNCQPTAEFFEVFTISADSVMDLTVWADDSADVFLNGVLLGPTATTQQSTNCAPTPDITCRTGTTVANGVLLTPGTYTLEFDTYQTGNGEFGLMYDGSVSTMMTGAPEPTSFILLSVGLAGLATLRRKRAA